MQITNPINHPLLSTNLSLSGTKFYKYQQYQNEYQFYEYHTLYFIKVFISICFIFTFHSYRMKTPVNSKFLSRQPKVSGTRRVIHFVTETLNVWA